MPLKFIQEVFSGATTSGGNLTIPSGSIVSYVPASSGSPEPTELVFGILETMHRSVTSGNPNYISTSATNTFSNNVFTRTYTFQVSLDFNPNTNMETLNVVPEPTTTTTAAP